MGVGTRYPHIEKLLTQNHQAGRVLELGAGGAVYKDIFDDYVGTDLLGTNYYQEGDLSAFCDARYLPFKDNSFDLVFQIASLCLIPKPERVCQETLRILRPGGKFIVFDYTLSTKEDLMRRHEANGDNLHMSFWKRSELCELMLQSGYSSANPLETKIHWKIISNLLPWIADHKRHWLMVCGKK